MNEVICEGCGQYESQCKCRPRPIGVDMDELKASAQVARDKSLKLEEVLNQAHELRRREIIEKEGG